MRYVFLTAALSLLIAAATQPGQAIYLSEEGTTGFLRGEINEGDGKVFAAFLERKRAAPLKVIYLNSPGGEVLAGVLIGFQVRKAKLDTALKAETVSCASSCTLIFAGGVRRYNIGGDKITSGLQGFFGLGYHPANSRGDAVRFTTKNTVGTEAMNRFYAMMGAPGAANMSRSAAINTLYRPSGKETLDLRIATSLGAPPN